MKKHIILLGFLAVGMAYAQTGKVGINTSTPEATLDINPSAANAVATANTNEGILIPRVSVARLNSIANSNLKESTLVYVDNITGTTNTVTSNVTSKGFYYYSSTEGKWVKIAEGTVQDQDLRFVGTNNHITQDAGKGGDGTDGGTGSGNIAIGRRSLFSVAGGSDNIAMGQNALYSNQGGVRNIALGNSAIYSNTGGFENIAIGTFALYSGQNVYHNIGIGTNALRNASNNSTGNVAIGTNTLMSGGSGVAIGYYALTASTTGYSTAIGQDALRGNTTGLNNIGIGQNALRTSSTGSDNLAIGNSALYTNTTGSNNFGFGTNVLRYNTTGSNNIGIGGSALFMNNTGQNNIGIGANGLRNNTTGNNNISFGTDALRSNTTGDRNIAIGEGTLSRNTTASYNVGLGISVLSSNTTGVANVGIGVNTLSGNTTGSSNVGIGNRALFTNTTGIYNIAIGYNPLSRSTTGQHNIALGYGTLENNISGHFNTAVGAYALSNNTTGQHNNAQGLNALLNNTTGSNNIALGNASGGWIRGNSNVHLGSGNFQSASTSELDNVVVIGNGINATELTASTGQDNTIILGYKKGHSFSPNVGLGTYKPDAKLHIETNGPTAIKIVDTNQAEGKVLTSDANGVGTWKEVAVTMGSGILGGEGVDIPQNITQYLYTGTYVVVPARTKYLVTVTFLMSQRNGAADANFWLRTKFTDSPTSQVTSPQSGEYFYGVQRKTLISGLLPKGAPYAMLQGSIILDNSAGANARTFYYMAGDTEVVGGPASGGRPLYRFGGRTWGEGNISAMPIQ